MTAPTFGPVAPSAPSTRPARVLVCRRAQHSAMFGLWGAAYLPWLLISKVSDLVRGEASTFDTVMVALIPVGLVLAGWTVRRARRLQVEERAAGLSIGRGTRRSLLVPWGDIDNVRWGRFTAAPELVLRDGSTTTLEPLLDGDALAGERQRVVEAVRHLVDQHQAGEETDVGYQEPETVEVGRPLDARRWFPVDGGHRGGASVRLSTRPCAERARSRGQLHGCVPTS